MITSPWDEINMASLRLYFSDHLMCYALCGRTEILLEIIEMGRVRRLLEQKALATLVLGEHFVPSLEIWGCVVMFERSFPIWLCGLTVYWTFKLYNSFRVVNSVSVMLLMNTEYVKPSVSPWEN